MEHQVLTGLYELKYRNKKGEVEIFISKDNALTNKINELCKQGIVNMRLTKLTNVVVDTRREGLSID